MSNNLIDLEGTWTSIMPIVLHNLPPVDQHGQEYPSCKHNEHSQTDVYQPVEASVLLSIHRASIASGPGHNFLGIYRREPTCRLDNRRRLGRSPTRRNRISTTGSGFGINIMAVTQCYILHIRECTTRLCFYIAAIVTCAARHA